MASPPKPWERNRATAASSPAVTMSSTTSTAPLPSAASAIGADASPAVPPIPANLTASVNQNAAAYSRLGASTAVTSPYGGYGGGAYSSPYRYGGYGSSLGGLGGGLGGGYGGGMYGGYGSSMYGGGMYGGGMYGGGMYGGGMQRDPNDPNSLTNRFNTGTQATFQMLEGIVGAFGGFAQMLESTYMATHSSFFAMVSVAEQFSNLRDTLGSILGIFTLMRWIRTLVAKLTGRPPPADAMALTPAAFARFEGRGSGDPSVGPNGAPKPSRKPLFFFVLAAFGLPYLMSKLIKSLAASHEEEERRQMALLQQQQQQQAVVAAGQLDPSKLEFCRVLYDFTPDASQMAAMQGLDLSVKRDDLIVVLAKTDPSGNPSEWWQCRTRDGRVGYLPSTFLRLIATPGPAGPAAQQTLMPPVPAAPSVAGSEAGGRANTITSSAASVAAAPVAAAAAASVAAAPASVAAATPAVSVKPSPAAVAAAAAKAADPVMAEKAAAQKQASGVTAESFMKSAFYQS